jgi:uncharacterized membrane protein
MLRFDAFVLSLGVGFSVSGIIFFFAYNWSDLHRYLKTGTLQFLLIASVSIVLHPRISILTRKIVLTGASLLTGALFAVFGQIYQTGADAFDLFLAWTLFIVLWTIVSHFPPLWLIFITLINITFVLYSQQIAQGWMGLLVATVLFLFNSALCIMFIYLAKWKKELRSPDWFLYILALSAVCFSSFGLISGFVNSNYTKTLWVLLLSSFLLYTLGISYGFKEKNIFYPAIIFLSIIIIISSIWMENVHSKGEGIVLCFFIGVGVTSIVAGLIHFQKKWKNEK